MKKKQILITTVRYLLQAHTVVVSGVFLVDLMGVAEIVVVVVYYVCVCVCVCVCVSVCVNLPPPLGILQNTTLVYFPSVLEWGHARDSLVLAFSWSYL